MEADLSVDREHERQKRQLEAAEAELDHRQREAALLETEYAELLKFAHGLSGSAARAERRPLSTLGRRIVYGLAKLLGSTAGLSETEYGRRLDDFARHHSPKRFDEALEELSARHRRKRMALSRKKPKVRLAEWPLFGPIALVVHDAHPNGAQMLALALARFFAEKLGIEVNVVLLAGGDLTGEFEKVAIVHDLSGSDPAGEDGEAVARHLRETGVALAIVNSVASGRFVLPLNKAGVRTISLVHEMPGIISEHGLEDAALAIAREADTIVFPARSVAEAFATVAPYAEAKHRVQPQGLYQTRSPQDVNARVALRAIARKVWRAGSSDLVVIGAGFGDARKGIDLFVETAISECLEHLDRRFVWLGRVQASLLPALNRKIAEAGVGDRVILAGFTEKLHEALLGGDVFLLSSREDPFPSVVIEAMDAGLPIIAIVGTGGCADLVADGYGSLAEEATVAALRSALRALEEPARRAELCQKGRDISAQRFSFRQYAMDLASDWGARGPRISAVVPNYNYLRYLPDRIVSILEQTLPIYELIVLDDASSDGSKEWISANLPLMFPEARIILNERNYGSVLAQWSRGVLEARGDFVWIAEADDHSEPTFLERLAAKFREPDVSLAYAASRAIDRNGEILPVSYRDYTADISPTKWNDDFVESAEFSLSHDFAVKNIIPNVSAVLFRRERLASVLAELGPELANWRVAGDWRAYAAYLSLGGKVAYVAEALNSHRRHTGSITKRLAAGDHVREVERMQDFVARNFKPTPAVLDKAARYRDELRASFARPDVRKSNGKT